MTDVLPDPLGPATTSKRGRLAASANGCGDVTVEAIERGRSLPCRLGSGLGDELIQPDQGTFLVFTGRLLFGAHSR